MEQIKFSIVTPCNVWNSKRAEDLLRAIESVKKQTFDHGRFEHIIVNDGSTQPVDIPKYPWIKLIEKKHEERVVAYNEAFKQVQGEIFVLLDSDDELHPEYLQKVDMMFKRNPRYKLVNFGSIMIHKDGGTARRGAFKPARCKVGHEIFGGGNIVNGTFAWHRDIYEDLGAFPPKIIEDIDCSEINYGKEQPRNLSMCTPYDFSAAAQMEFPEIRKFFMVDHEAESNKIIKELGNPWGNDFYLFYKYTRKYYSKPIDEHLYIVHLK